MTRRELFWKTGKLALRRGWKDKRSLRVILLGLLLPLRILYLVSIGRQVSSEPAVLAWYGVLFGLALLVLYIMRRRQRSDEAGLLKLSAPRPPVELPAVQAEHRAVLSAELLRIACLVDRAGTELMHHTDQMPAGLEGLSRRRTLDLARREDLWSGFLPDEQESLLSQEGSWPAEVAWQTSLRQEDVRVLRFVLGLDRILTPFEFLEHDLGGALELTGQPARVVGKVCLEPTDLRPAELAADTMLARCLSEGADRGVFQVDAQHLAQLQQAGDGRGESTDLLIGAKTVEQAGEQSLRWMTLAAFRRARTIARVVAFLYARVGAADVFRVEPANGSETEAANI